MKQQTQTRVRFLATAGLIAGLYTALTVVLAKPFMTAKLVKKS